MTNDWFKSKFTAAELDGKSLYFAPPPQKDFFYGNMHVQANAAGLVQVDIDYGGPDSSGQIKTGRVSLGQDYIDGLARNSDANIHADFVIKSPVTPPSPSGDDGWITSKFQKAQLDGMRVYFALPNKPQRLYGHLRVQQNKVGKLHVAIEYNDPVAHTLVKFNVNQELMNHLEAFKHPVEFLLI